MLDSKKFGNYELIRLIAVGGMGEIYLARQLTAFNREVPIKIIRDDRAHDPVTRRRFQREAEVSAHLKHEHILQLIEFNEANGRLFLVTPYIEGGTLAKRLERGRLSSLEVHQLFTALVQAVAYIHRRGVVHRDLKPSNVLLDHGGNGQIYVRLIDFGIACILDQGEELYPALTNNGVEIGTVEYMAPERLHGINLPSNDIYSLGVILQQLLTGGLPSDRNASLLPAPFEPVVKCCLERDVRQRYATAEDLLDAFEMAFQQLIPPTTSIPPVTHQRARSVAGDSSSHPGAVTEIAAPESGGKMQMVASARPAQIEDAPTERPQLINSRPVLSHPSQLHFSQKDHNAPTTMLTVNASRPNVSRLTRKPAKRPRLPLLMATLLLVVAVTLLTGAYVLAAGIASFNNVTVNLSARTISQSQVFQITAMPGQQKIDVGQATIPATPLSASRSATQSGQATGKKCSFFSIGNLGCRKIVLANDVDLLATQLRQDLQNQLSQDLHGQAQAHSSLTVDNLPIQYSDQQVSPTPNIGATSNTVSVTLTEQARWEAVSGTDAQALARQLLMQQVQAQGEGYKLVDASVKISTPVVVKIDPNGAVTLKIAAGGLAQHSLTPDELTGLKDHMKGLSVKQAKDLLKKQPGIDPNSIQVRLNGVGENLPGSADQIKIVPLPPTGTQSVVQLTPIPKVNLPTPVPPGGDPNTLTNGQSGGAEPTPQQ